MPFVELSSGTARLGVLHSGHLHPRLNRWQRMTKVRLTLADGEELYGLSSCSINDLFCKRTGKKIAMLKVFENDTNHRLTKEDHRKLFSLIGFPQKTGRNHRYKLHVNS